MDGELAVTQRTAAASTFTTQTHTHARPNTNRHAHIHTYVEDVMVTEKGNTDVAKVVEFLAFFPFTSYTFLERPAAVCTFVCVYM